MNFVKLAWIVGFVLFLVAFSAYVVPGALGTNKQEATGIHECGCNMGKQLSCNAELSSIEPLKLQQTAHTAKKTESLQPIVNSIAFDQESPTLQNQTEFSADLCNQFCDCVPNGSMPNGWTGSQSSIGCWENCWPCTLLRWPLSDLPGDIVVTEATIKLYCHSHWGSISGRLFFAPVTSNWNSAVTYSTRPVIDESQAIEVSWPNRGQWFEVDITSIVEQWSEGTLSNYGIQAYSTGTARTGGIDIRSPGWSDPQFSPKLTIHYNVTPSTTENGLYFNQEPPGLVPEVFAPGIICLENRYEQYATFSPDGNEFCFSVTNSSWSTSNAWHTKREQGYWTDPKPANFTGSGDVWCPHFSPDGEGFYFASSRPNYPPMNIWMCEKTSDGWSAPVKLGSPVSSSRDEWGFSIMLDKSIYLCSHRSGGSGGCDIWYCHYENGQYVTAENIAILNTTSNDCAPCVSCDQSFLVFNSNKPGGYGSADLYISYRLEDGSWTAPRNLGPIINTSDSEFAFSLSPDEKYFFFTRRTNNNSDIYWVDAKAILPDPNGPIKNFSTNQRFSSIQCAIDYAQSGDKIVIGSGLYQESIDLTGKIILLQSVDPNDPFYIGGTVIQGRADSSVVTLQDNPQACEIAGMTIRAGSVGITGTVTNATVRNCRIMDNTTHGLELSQSSSPLLKHCLITSNGQTGITMHPSKGRGKPPCAPVIENCIIVDNGNAAIDGGEPNIIDSIIQD